MIIVLIIILVLILGLSVASPLPIKTKLKKTNKLLLCVLSTFTIMFIFAVIISNSVCKADLLHNTESRKKLASELNIKYTITLSLLPTESNFCIKAAIYNELKKQFLELKTNKQKLYNGEEVCIELQKLSVLENILKENGEEFQTYYLLVKEYNETANSITKAELLDSENTVANSCLENLNKIFNNSNEKQTLDIYKNINLFAFWTFFGVCICSVLLIDMWLINLLKKLLEMRKMYDK